MSDIQLDSDTKLDSFAENRRITANVVNNSSQSLVLASNVLDWGKWVQTPTNTIDAGHTGTFICCGAAGSATGTSGQVQYGIGSSTGSLVTLNFDDPYTGSNNFSSSCADSQYSITNDNPQGLGVTVTYTFS